MSPWRPTRGTWTVVVLELRQRLRSTRWKIALAAWFAVVGLITALIVQAAGEIDDELTGVEHTPKGPLVFGLVVFFVLLLGLLVSPALAAGGVNGDRNAGTLATLQMSRLTACDIALGKLLAAWAVSLAFLAVSLPFIVWGLALGGTSIGAMVVCLLVLALELAVVCAIGLGFSALITRTIGSTLLTYLVVAALAVGTLVLAGLGSTMVSGMEKLPTYGAGPNAGQSDATFPPPDDSAPVTAASCHWYESEQYVSHTERIWWLLAPNPFVIVADAAPSAATRPQVISDADPLGVIKRGMREMRLGAPEAVDDCQWQAEVPPSYVSPVPERKPSSAPVWPWGLGVNLLLGIGGFVVAVRRLTIPYAKLPRATRVA